VGFPQKESSIMTAPCPILSRGVELPTGREHFGVLRESADALHHLDELRQRLDDDGYLYLPGFWSRESVREVRLSVLRQLAALGCLDPAKPFEEGWSNADVPPPAQARTSPLDQCDPRMMSLLYGSRLLNLFAALLGGPVLHYDFTWFRTHARGLGTKSHCDIVFMGRGTFRVYTAWTPLGDIDRELGGLILLEGSHKKGDRLSPYLKQDVDTHCTNHPAARERGRLNPDGAIADDPESVRRRLGGRWLMADSYRMGDVLIFGMGLVHASLDNRSERIRISTDTRYQLARDAVDERWTGIPPIGHGPGAARGMIC